MLIKYLFEYILSYSSCCSLVVFSAQAKQLNWWKHFMFQFLGLSRLHRFCGYTPKHTHGYVKHTPCRHDDVVIVGRLKRETLRCEHRNDKLLWFNVHISICALILLFTHTHTRAAQPHTHTHTGRLQLVALFSVECDISIDYATLVRWAARRTIC